MGEPQVLLQRTVMSAQSQAQNTSQDTTDSPTMTTEDVLAHLATILPYGSRTQLSIRFLGLSAEDVDRCQNMIELFEVVLKILNKWRIRNNPRVKTLKEKLTNGVTKSNLLTPAVLELDDWGQYSDDGEVNDSLLYVVAMHMPNPQWEMFAIEYLNAKQVEIDEAKGISTVDPSKVMLEILRKWLQNNHPNNTLENLKCALEKAQQVGGLDCSKATKYLQTKIDVDSLL